MSNSFATNNIKRNIDRVGSVFQVFRQTPGKFNEVSSEPPTLVKDLKCIYHVSSVRVSRNNSEGSITKNVEQPMLLCIASEVTDLAENDLITINGITHKLVSKGFLEPNREICDLSLEVVQK